MADNLGSGLQLSMVDAPGLTALHDADHPCGEAADTIQTMLVGKPLVPVPPQSSEVILHW